MSRARTRQLETEAKSPVTTLRRARDYERTFYDCAFRKCPWQESNPWGSVLRVICVTIRLSYNRGDAKHPVCTLLAPASFQSVCRYYTQYR